MGPRRRGQFWTIRSRGAVAALVLLAHVISAVGLPVPQWRPITPKDASLPFPCLSRACGCLTAEQCWQGCCCFTDREKLAWAEANGVDVPEFVRARAAAECDGSAACCCCAADKPGDCPHCRAIKKPSTRAASKSDAKVGWVDGTLLRQCRGAGPFGTLGAASALPPPPAATWAFAWVSTGWFPFLDLSPLTRYHRPELPPPRF
jgi:hypothetical protein